MSGHDDVSVADVTTTLDHSLGTKGACLGAAVNGCGGPGTDHHRNLVWKLLKHQKKRLKKSRKRWLYTRNIFGRSGIDDDDEEETGRCICSALGAEFLDLDIFMRCLEKEWIHSQKHTWNLKMMVFKRNLFFKGLFSGSWFIVCFRPCIFIPLILWIFVFLLTTFFDDQSASIKNIQKQSRGLFERNALIKLLVVQQLFYAILWFQRIQMLSDEPTCFNG